MAEELLANEVEPSEIGFEEDFDENFEMPEGIEEFLAEELKETTEFWFHQSIDQRPCKPRYKKNEKTGYKVYIGHKRYDPKNEFEFMGVSFCSKDELKAILVKMRIFIYFSCERKFRVMSQDMINLELGLKDLYFQKYLGYYYETVQKKQHKAQMSNPSITSNDVSTSNCKKYKWNIKKDKVENPRYWYKNIGKRLLKHNNSINRYITPYVNLYTRRDLFYMYDEIKQKNEVEYLYGEIDKMPKRLMSNIYDQHFILDFLFRDIIPEFYLDSEPFERHVIYTYKTFHEELSRKIGNPRYFLSKVNEDLLVNSDELRSELIRLGFEPDITGVISYYSQFHYD